MASKIAPEVVQRNRESFARLLDGTGFSLQNIQEQREPYCCQGSSPSLTAGVLKAVGSHFAPD
jgi:hypothetical protein